MKRQIFEVYAKVVDANGAYNTLSGYPKVFDSRNYNNDIDKTIKRARGDFHDTVGAMSKRDDRQLQTVILISADGFLLETPQTDGAIADIPDPTPEPEPEGEPEAGEGE